MPTTHDMQAPRERAVLVGVQLPEVDDVDHQASLDELSRLVSTLGHDVVGRITQRRDAIAHSTVLGEGKLKELAEFTGGTGIVPSTAPEKKNKARARMAGAEEEPDEAEAVDEDDDGDEVAAREGQATLVAVDHDISPSQARNLEKATGARVLDRTGVIVEIFHRHANSREARLQVEIARLIYVAPRMRETGSGGDRQRGGIGGKGAGESAMELDRRKIRDRIAELRTELEAVQREQGTRRARRANAMRVALVGYTNAGKSSMMRALTGSEVYVADKLFATLDTTVRALVPETRPRILVSDTVGFIKKLPHDLVASFRSTLDEALEASLLLYVVDASDPTFRAQLEVTRTVLGEIGAGVVPSRLLLNKIDRVDAAGREALALEYPDALQVSARDPKDVSIVRDAIVAWFERDMIEGELRVPHGAQGIVGEVHERARVLDEAWDEEGVRFTLKAHADTLAKLEALVASKR